MKSIYTFYFAVLCYTTNIVAQDINYAKSVIETLTSKKYAGRGYVKNGEHVAATFISKEFLKFELKPFGRSYNQDFSFPVNTFPGKMAIVADGVSLIPGIDFIVDPACPAITGTFEIVELLTVDDWYKKSKLDNKIVLIDLSLFSDSLKKVVRAYVNENHSNIGFIYLEEKKLTWSVSTSQKNKFSVSVLKQSFNKNSKTLKVNIDALILPNHKSQNVIGFIEGEVKDSFVVYTGHYDHLGMMGKKTIFPGANDNASGISFLLNLAKHYSKHKPKYTVVFIAFAGEEAGLIGSRYYTENPLFELNRSKFLLNFDLMGTGDEGIMVVNATEFSEAYTAMVTINNDNNLLTKVDKRGKAANSDHYWFTEKGVPSFFIYTLGGIKAYHDVYDIAKTLPLTEYEDLFKLVTLFANQIN